MSSDGNITSPESQFRFRLRTVFFGVTALAIAIGIGAESSRRASAERNRKRIILCLHHLGECFAGYETVLNKPWPPRVVRNNNDQELYSWRVPLIFETHIYACKDCEVPNLAVAWNDPANTPYAGFESNYFCGASQTTSKTARILGIAGADTAFDASAPKYGELPDDLIVLAEAADSQTHWMQPGDYSVADLLAATGRLGDSVKGALSDRVYLLFADGQAWALSSDTPIEVVKPFLTIASAKMASRGAQLAQYRVE